MSQPTNILFLPPVGMIANTATNADWLDGLEYQSSADINATPIDLTGIKFEMDMRAAPPLATVVLRATTENGLIRVYANTWQFMIPASTMILVPPGDYVFDMLAHGDGFTRNIVYAQVAVLLGITRSASPNPQPVAGPHLVRVHGTANQIQRVTGVNVPMLTKAA
jgi:hypothetical protein